MSTETLPSSPDAAREVAPSTRDFLENLKREVQAVDDAEGKKALIRERLKGMEKKDLDALKQNIDQNQIPQDLLDAIVDLRLLVDAQKAVLREAIANGQASTAEQKPEGWMAWAGDQMKGGVQKVEQWTDWAWDKTKSGFGAGWAKTLEGLSATGEWFMKMWGKVESSFNAARAGIAVALGGLVAKMEKILPTWLKDGFNTLVGNYGVFYATLSRLGVKIAGGAAQLAQGASEQINASVDHFSEIYEQAKAWGNTSLDFPGFIREVASRLRKVQPSLTFTMADMVAMAGIVAGEKQVNPAAPAVAPGAAPIAAAAVPASVPPEQLTRTEVASLTVGGVTISKLDENGEMLLKMGDQKYRVKPHVLFGMFTPTASVTKVEKVSDGTVALTGSLGISGTVIVTEQELGRVARAVSQAGGNHTLEVAYKNLSGVDKKRMMTFEVVTP